MKKFPFYFSAVIIAVLIAVGAIFGFSVATNVYYAVKFFGAETARAVVHILIALLSLFMCGTAFFALFFGRYEIKGGTLYCKLGLFTFRTEVKDIFQVTEFKAQKKLVAYLVPEKFTVIVIKEKYYAGFCAALKAVNPSIVYTVENAEEKD
ncbi:MAG: hypothetical protein IJQ66_00040 [Clostridia bacterium]|nr:hypothetical protein [Clostridia bacterium]